MHPGTHACANVAVAVNPELTYAVVAAGGSRYYVHEDRVDHLARVMALKQGNGAPRYSVERRVTGRELLDMDLVYRAPFDDLPAASAAEQSQRLIAWDEVNADEGTGLVHIAPGCGVVLQLGADGYEGGHTLLI